jgi:hypothetical protein
MPFDKEAEGNEPLRKIEMFFDSGRPQSETDLPMPPTAYIGMGSFGTSRSGDHPMLTNNAASYGELKAEVDGVKAALDALLGEAKACFAASISN